MEGTTSLNANDQFLTVEIPNFPGIATVLQQTQDSLRTSDSSEKAILADQPQDQVAIQADTVPTGEAPDRLPEIERDEKGRITKGVAQDTNKNGTAGRHCEACEKMPDILNIVVTYYNEGVEGCSSIVYISA